MGVGTPRGDRDTGEEGCPGTFPLHLRCVGTSSGKRPPTSHLKAPGPELPGQMWARDVDLGFTRKEVGVQITPDDGSPRARVWGEKDTVKGRPQGSLILDLGGGGPDEEEAGKKPRG